MADDTDRPTRSEEEILMSIYKRARVLRLHKLLTQAASGMLVVALLGGSTFLVMSRSDEATTTPQHPPTLVDESKDETAKVPLPPVKKKRVKASSPKPTPKETQKATQKEPAKEDPEPEPTKSSDPGCLDSFDPDCGPFFWASSPASNAPIQITADASEAVAGSAVELLVRASDADAPIWRDAYKVDWGDGTKTVGSFEQNCKKGYGKWTLPPGEGDSYQKTFTHTYASAGTYTVWVMFKSHDQREGPEPCQQAYASADVIKVTIVVEEPAPSPEPSPSPSA